jgi:hypothetical protein
MQRWFVLSLIEIGQLVLENKIFKDFFPIWTRIEMVFPIVASPNPRGPWFVQCESALYQETFV